MTNLKSFWKDYIFKIEKTAIFFDDNGIKVDSLRRFKIYELNLKRIKNIKQGVAGCLLAVLEVLTMGI